MKTVTIAIRSQGILRAGKCRIVENDGDAIVGDEWTTTGTVAQLREWAMAKSSLEVMDATDAYETRVGRNVLDLLEGARE